MPQPDYENDLVFPPQSAAISFKSSSENPKGDCYILSDDNHIAWYYGGLVYYLAKYPSKKEPELQISHLCNWCKRWIYLRDVCSPRRYKAAGGKNSIGGQLDIPTEELMERKNSAGAEI